MPEPIVFKLSKTDRVSQEIAHALKGNGVIVFTNPNQGWIEERIPKLVELYLEEGKKVAHIMTLEELFYTDETNARLEKGENLSAEEYQWDFKKGTIPKFPPAVISFPPTVLVSNQVPNFEKNIRDVMALNPDVVILEPIRGDVEMPEAVLELAKKYIVITAMHVTAARHVINRFLDIGVAQEKIDTVQFVIVSDQEAENWDAKN